jgi:hypothetical protein
MEVLIEVKTTNNKIGVPGTFSTIGRSSVANE